MKDIPGFEQLYAITEDGKVWSYPKKASNRMSEGKFLTSTVSKGKNRKDGYLGVKLGRGRSYTIHSLVANAFVENPNNFPCIDHIDNNKMNNNYWNLRWVSYSENNLKMHEFLENKPWQCHAKRVGRFSLKGDFIDEFSSVVDAHKIIGGNRAAISQCARGENKSSGGFIWQYL